MSDDAYRIAYERERAARKAAEAIVERKSRELYLANAELKALNGELEARIEQRTRELAEALERAEANAQARSRFLSMMSHEMRTPLNSIVGLTELLALETVSDRAALYLDNLRFGARQLLSLVNDVLDMSAIEAGKVTFESAAIDLREVATSLREMYAARAAAQGLGWSVTIDGELPVRLFGDAGKLNQVLINLCDNAFKFTAAGSVALRIEAVDDGAETAFCRLRCAVADTGKGISAADQTRIFEFFEQVTHGLRREHGGSGLGLAICRHLVELQGGSIGCESALGEGTTLWFELPLALAPATAAAPLAEQPSPEALKGLRLLLVEDVATNRLVIREMARRWGVVVTEAQDGQEALRLLDDSDFDLVLTDLHMPRLDGEALVRAIRQRERGGSRRQPIICLTADAQQEQHDQVLAAGADACLSKPVQFRRLFEALCLWSGHAASPA